MTNPRWRTREVAVAFWLGGAIATFLLIGAHDPTMSISSRLIGALGWPALLPIYSILGG